MTETFRLLSRPGCHLCDEMRTRALPLLSERGDALVELDVDSDPALRERFGNEIPVLLDGAGRVVAKALDGADALARRLARRR
ncbi:MAG TPA: glutaredoxin family protein [Thermoanaerobaculia bacterium]|nr:glutaredoxin family protein [Thermoanaerobaculia bacterium]